MTTGTSGPDVWELAARAFESGAATDLTTPGGLATALDPATVQTAALQLIDQGLADIDAGLIDRLMIDLPPQEGKSSRVARVGTLWALRRNPDRRCAIASYDLDLARGHSQWVRDSILTHGTDAPMAGGIDLLGLGLRAGARAASRFSISGRRGGCVAAGIGGGLTGKPVDWMVIDDPIKDRVEADSLLMRNRVWDWWTDVVIPRLAPGAPVILVMTRWHEDDLAGRLIAEDEALPEEDRRWRVIHIPAQCDDPEKDLLGRKLGEFLESARRRTVEQWKRIRRTVGARAWGALYQGRPSPAEGGIFKWDWIRPHRVARRDVPDLQRIVVALDTTGGGHDAAGIVVAGRGEDRRTYVLADVSRQETAGGQWRRGWMACLDYEADVLVYENNLVDPIMRRSAPAAWARMVEQAKALKAAGVLNLDLDDVDPEVLERRVRKAAEQLTVGGDDDVVSADDPHAALVGQLEAMVPYAVRVLASPVRGPARLSGVRATRGKAIRAEPVSQAYETGQVSHCGVFPALEQELVTWQEGQDSPNRLDALVWAWTYLNGVSTSGTVGSAAGRGRISTGPSTTGGR